MCTGSGEEDGVVLDNHSESMEGQKCSGPAKGFLFFVNFLIWLGSCALLGLGIFGLVDSPFTRDIGDGKVIISVAIILIIVGGIGFIISFIGCCGAMTGSKCLVLTYVIVLSLLLALLLIGAILGFLFKNRLNDFSINIMRESIEKYDPDDTESPIVRSWNNLQMTLKCCGADSYKDWESFNENYSSTRKFPESCCKREDGDTTSGCTTAVTESTSYSRGDEGCQDRLVEMVENHTPIVAGVAAGVAFLMVLGLVIGIITFTRL